MDLSLIDPPCFIGSCKAQGGLLRMLSFSKEHDRNVFSCPFYCVKWGPQNLMITAPARIGFTAFNRVCSNGHPVIYDTARVISKGSNQTKSDQSGPTPFLCGFGAYYCWRLTQETGTIENSSPNLFFAEILRGIIIIIGA